MLIHLKIVGWMLIMLSFVHFIFPKRFDWKNNLQSLSLINKQIMIVHTFFVALFVLMIGLLSVFCADDLINTKLGKQISLGLAIFWMIRFYFQVFVYSPKLWRGKKLETGIHILFSIFWIYAAAVFASVLYIE